MVDLIRKYCDFALIDKDAKETFVSSYSKLISDENRALKLNNLIYRYTLDVSNCKAIVDEIKALFIQAGVHEYTANAVSYILLIPALKKEYEKRNIPSWIFESSIKDISYHVDYSKNVKGVWGTFTNWHANFFSIKGYGFGRLQFIPKPSYADFKGEGINVSKGDPIIEVHIPYTKTPLLEKECEICYKKAYEYFKDYFKGAPVIFHCSSWLLWEKHYEILPPQSNIVKFMKKFTLVEKGLYNDYSELWRIFQVDYKGNLSDLPVNTSLHKAYVDIVSKGEKTGWGTGLFIYNDGAN